MMANEKNQDILKSDGWQEKSRYEIYQLKDVEGTRNFRFMPLHYLEEKGIPIKKENYDLVYTASFEEGMDLERIYEKFNLDHPSDFTGHSLSVSDVVVLYQNGEEKSYYTDSFGFREVPEFTKEIAHPEKKEQGNTLDEAILDYVLDITDDPKAIERIIEMMDKLPDIEVREALEKWQAVYLATEIDQLSYEYDPKEYQREVANRGAEIVSIAEDIRNGNTEYLRNFLKALVSESVRMGITDVFSQGVELDDSKAVRTARKAQELLDKLAEYKPLAKVEELEEQNYNMVDNVLNNGAGEKRQEQPGNRVSVKEKLTEKKTAMEQRMKSERGLSKKEAERQSQREI